MYFKNKLDLLIHAYLSNTYPMWPQRGFVCFISETGFHSSEILWMASNPPASAY